MGYIKRHAYAITVTFIIAALLTAAYAAGFVLTRDRAQPQVELASTYRQYPTEDCELVQTLTFSACAHMITVRSAITDGLAGLTLREMSETYPRWKFTELSPHLVALSRTVDGYCPEHVLLKYENERLTLLRMSADGTGCEVEKYYAGTVTYSAQKQLEVGRVFGTEGEARAYIFKNRR